MNFLLIATHDIVNRFGNYPYGNQNTVEYHEIMDAEKQYGIALIFINPPPNLAAQYKSAIKEFEFCSLKTTIKPRQEPLDERLKAFLPECLMD